MGWFICSVVLLIVSVGWFVDRANKKEDSPWNILLFLFMYASIFLVVLSPINGLHKKADTINNIEYRMEGSKNNNIYFRMVKVNTQDTILYNPNTKHVIEFNIAECDSIKMN